MRRFLWNAALLAASLLAFYVAYVAIRVEQQAKRDEARQADIIVVLGAAEYRGRPSPVLRLRLDHALELYNAGLAPRIMTTGGAGGDPMFTEGGVGRSYLIARGVPSESIVVETEGESTVHSISAAAEIMRRMGLHSCIVVTDGYHVFRVKRMLEARGIAAYGSPRAPVRPGALTERWLYIKQAIGYTLWSLGVPV